MFAFDMFECKSLKSHEWILRYNNFLNTGLALVYPPISSEWAFVLYLYMTKQNDTGLNPSKALGPDELHQRVLKELATELGPIFAHLFQQSIDKGEIPKELSLANICPLVKKGDRSLACNYRPVSLTCVPCKLLEHMLNRKFHTS